MKRIIKTIIGLILFPLIISVSVAFYKQFLSLNIFSIKQQLAFFYGIGAYIAVHLFLFKPATLYVFGHEMVHVLATWLCFGKVTSFNISSGGGQVTTTKSNAFISLSPYFISFYTVLTALLYFALSYARPMGVYGGHFIFWIGLTIAFHIIMTVDTLKIKQPDLLSSGYVLSLVLIYVVNVIVVSLVLALLFDSFEFTSFCRVFWAETKDIYATFFTTIKEQLSHVARAIKN